jgi:hypothetical protein
MAETKKTPAAKPVEKPVAIPIYDIPGSTDNLPDVTVVRYPRSDQTEHYRAEVLAPITGIPTIKIAPVGWVGPAPLTIPESRVDELIELLTRIR